MYVYVCVCVCVCVCLIVCDLEISTVNWLRFDFDFCATGKTEVFFCTRNIKKMLTIMRDLLLMLVEVNL